MRVARGYTYLYITYQKIYVKMMPVTTNLLFFHVVCTKGLVAGAKIVDTIYFGICTASEK